MYFRNIAFKTKENVSGIIKKGVCKDVNSDFKAVNSQNYYKYYEFRPLKGR